MKTSGKSLCSVLSSIEQFFPGECDMKGITEDHTNQQKQKEILESATQRQPSTTPSFYCDIHTVEEIHVVKNVSLIIKHFEHC